MRIHNAYLTARSKAIHSAMVEEGATIDCFLLDHEMGRTAEHDQEGFGGTAILIVLMGCIDVDSRMGLRRILVKEDSMWMMKKVA